jgi:hypothetical protein
MDNFDELFKKANQGAGKQFQEEGREVVEMNQSKTIEIIPTGKEIELFTTGTNGCTLVLAIAKKDSGEVFAHLSHFDPTLLTEQIDELQKLINRKINSLSLIIITRGDYVKKGEKYVMETTTDSQKEIEKIVSIAESVDFNVIKVLPYSTGIVVGQARETRFQISRKNNETTAKVMWWKGTETL